MEFAREKCAMLQMKMGKAEGIELPNQKRIRTLGERENLKYLEIVEADTIKQAEMKGKIRK